MKFNFKIQQYQSNAVDNIVRVFSGQSFNDGYKYRMDLGSEKSKQMKLNFESDDFDSSIDVGYKNNSIELSNDDLLYNIKEIQKEFEIKPSKELDTSLGRCSLDVEMETGTGKTYVYTKMMFELNKHYGWSKFIVVVPSIAIREGVKKSMEITEQHFMEQYGKKARFFIYNSSNLHKLDEFAQSSGINVMIINSQAFASSLKEGGKSKDSRIIYSERDEFASRRPIDVIKATNPIIILDEPQKLSGEKTQDALRKNFNALFSVNFSATHRTEHNRVYILDAVDAYNQKLVKKIRVNGLEVKNLLGTDCYLYLEDIVLDPVKPPRARVELEVKRGTGIRRETHLLNHGDSLFSESNELPAYKGLFITDISAEGSIQLSNGEVVYRDEIINDVADMNLRRVQIRETILAHLDKEEKLFHMGIKCLSLFFIDEVKKYRLYDEDGKEGLGEYGKIFEEEYSRILEERSYFYDPDYMEYVKSIPVKETHGGYFSIDKNNRAIDSKEGNPSDYEKIMKHKEILLSFDEPIRFIFSHSALREGWDNPNIFQICALKHSDSSVDKRQEVGRGLRICVDKNGTRMDVEECGDEFHNINTLTVIASEGYDTFVKDLQDEIKKNLRERPRKVDLKTFVGKYITDVNGEKQLINEGKGRAIYNFLIKGDYIDDEGRFTGKCMKAVEEGILFIDDISPLFDIRFGLVDTLKDMMDGDVEIENGGTPRIRSNKLTENFKKKEFQTLWNEINNKYAYRVSFDSEELIRKTVKSIDEDLNIVKLSYTRKVGEQKTTLESFDVNNNTGFTSTSSSTKELESSESNVKYDLVGEIASGCTLTRRTVVRILKEIEQKKFDMFKQNPGEFIQKMIRLINDQKATMVVEHVEYNKLEDRYDRSIFTAGKQECDAKKAYPSKKGVQEYVFTDGTAEDNIERKFAKALDDADEVCVYAKLPRAFQIPTPVGNYAPDWAIAFNDGAVRHIFFIAETKGSMNSMDFRGVEKAKIECAKKLFNEMSTSKVRYHNVDTYDNLLKVMKNLD